MSTQLQHISTTDVLSISKAFMESGMFPDIKSASQAMVKIQAGQELGIKPFAAMNGIHIIQGKATIGAGLIASSIKGSGKYDYRIKEQSDKACEIEFFQGKESLGKSRFTIEEAKKAGTKNIDKFPANMLFARAISNGVKWYTPDVFQGPVYVPEEMEHLQTTVDTVAEVVDPTPQVPTIATDVLEAIEKVPMFNTLAELKAFKDALPKHIQDDNDFKLVAKKRYDLVTSEGFLATHSPELNTMIVEPINDK